MTMLGAVGIFPEPMGRWQGESGFLLSHSASSLSLPSELDIRSSIMPPPFRVLPSSASFSDIIVLAEFSEIEGPMPLLTIPSAPKSNLDLNDFVVKVMSTDYQNTGGEFHISHDTQLVQLDIEPGIHVYVHYFTLHDVRARGFVRPMCLTYISSDSRKLLHYFDNLRQQFSQVTNYLKISNHKWFISEMEDLVSDLEYTKQRYIQLHRHDQLDLNQVCPLEESSEILPNAFTSGPASLAFDAMEITNMNLISNNQPTKEGDGGYHESKECGESEKETKTLEGDFYENSHRNGSAENNNTNYKYRESINVENKAKNDLSSKLNMKNKYTSPTESLDKNKVCDLETILNSSFPKSKTNVISESPEESILRQTTLEAVANQLLDCQQIVNTVKAYVDQEEKDSFIEQLLREVESQPKSPLYQCLDTLKILPRRRAESIALYKPNVRLMSYRKRECLEMRNVADMCGIGHVASIIKLRSIYQSFSRSTITLMFENVDANFQDDKSGSLFIGNLPMINIMKKQKSQDSHVNQLNESVYASSCWDMELASLLCPMNNITTKQSQSIKSNEFIKSCDISPGSDCLEVFDLPTESTDTEDSYRNSGEYLVNSERQHDNIQDIQKEVTGIYSEHKYYDRSTSARQLSSSSNSSSTWSSNAAVQALDMASYEEVEEEEGVEEEVMQALLNRKENTYLDIDQRMIVSKGCRLSGLIQQFCGVSHCLVHSLLSGRPVILAGAEPFRQLVEIYVKAAADLLPRKSHQTTKSVLKWHMGTITPHHLEMYQIMGVAIPERLHVQDLMSNSTLNRVTVLNIETGHISGVAYGGSLVRGVEQFGRRYFRSDASLQTAMQSMLITAGIKVYLLSHLQRTTNRSSTDILKACGVVKGDWDTIRYLNSLVQIREGNTESRKTL